MNKKKKKIIIIVSIVVVLLIGIGLGFFFYFKNKNNQPIKNVEVVDTISEYGYNLEDRDTVIYKEAFNNLKDVLKEEEINYEEYANCLGKLFIIDLYTIENKVNKYDVGSLDFIYPSEKEKFQNKVMDTMYKLVEDNTSNTRKQELPVVKNVTINSTQNTTYKKGDTELVAYLLDITISYEKELGYDEHITLTIAKEENKLYVVNLTSHVD